MQPGGAAAVRRSARHAAFVLFPETTKAFSIIAAQEPSCAMAYWGIAISQRPNPLSMPIPPALMKHGWEAIEKARAAGLPFLRDG